MRLYGLILSLALLPATAQAKDWKHLVSHGEVDYSIDQTSISHKGDLVSFWEWIKGTPLTPVVKGHPDIASLKVNRSINCKTHEVKQLELYELDESRTNLAHLKAPPHERYKPIVKNSINDLEYHLLCHHN